MNELLNCAVPVDQGGEGASLGELCAVARDGDTVTLTKNVPVISYGEYADAILVTARRTADSPPSDQVLVVCRRDDVNLEPTGTCSPGFVLIATTSADLVVGTAYAEISSHHASRLAQCVVGGVARNRRRGSRSGVPRSTLHSASVGRADGGARRSYRPRDCGGSAPRCSGAPRSTRELRHRSIRGALFVSSIPANPSCWNAGYERVYADPTGSSTSTSSAADWCGHRPTRSP